MKLVINNLVRKLDIHLKHSNKNSLYLTIFILETKLLTAGVILIILVFICINVGFF